MAIYITKTLQGLITIEDAGSSGTNVTLVLPTLTGTALPNALDNSTIEEVYICNNNNNGASLYLPAISLFKGAKNVKIYVNINVGPGDIQIIPYNDEELNINTINGSIGSQNITGFGAAGYLHITSDNNWMFLKALSRD
jgi:hypothetical protein